MAPRTPPVPCLVGPTGSGKSAVALEVARRLRAEVVCCDALTVYRGLDVLTAKPCVPEDVPHHLLGVVGLHETYSAARFVEDADRAIEAIHARDRVPLVVGGSALYLVAWRKGLGAGTGRDPALRARLEDDLRRDGPDALHARLAAVDPRRAADLHRNDVRRVVRALEIVSATGGPASDRRREWDAPDRVASIAVGLRRHPDDLRARIDARARAMPALGVVAEALAARDAMPPPSAEASQALGLADVLAHAEGRLSLSECVERLAAATRRLARRQRTFFRRLPVRWIDVAPDEPPDVTAGRVVLAFGASGEPYAPPTGTSA